MSFFVKGPRRLAMVPAVPHLAPPGVKRSYLSAACFLTLMLLVLARAAEGLAEDHLGADPVTTRKLYESVGVLYGVDPALLEAIATVESDGRKKAVSAKGAEGLMQLMPATAEQFDVADPFDPVDNLLGAARFIRFLQTPVAIQTGAAPKLAVLLAAYNAGPGAIAKYKGIPPYAETLEYVRKVLLAYLLHYRDQVAVPPSARHRGANIPSSRFDGTKRDNRWLAQIEQIRRLRDRRAFKPGQSNNRKANAANASGQPEWRQTALRPAKTLGR
jgi:hypothetical protein